MENNQPIPNPNLQTPNPQPTDASLTAKMTPVSQQPAPKKKFPKWIIIVLIILLSGITGLFIFRNYQFKQQAAQTQPILTPITSTPMPMFDPTADWKTHRNEVYKFTINYPSDWKYEEKTYRSSRDEKTAINETLFSPIQVFDINPGVFSITIYKPVNDLTLEAFLSTYLCFPIGEGNNRCSSVSEGAAEFPLSMPAKKITYHPVAHFGEAVVIKKDGDFYEFEIDFEKPIYENKNVSPDERRELFNQILSTFTFTN